MFKSLRSVEASQINHSGRSHIGETMQLEGDLRTSGSIYAIDFVNEGNGWVTGGGGSILKYTNPIPFITDFSPKNWDLYKCFFLAP